MGRDVAIALMNNFAGRRLLLSMGLTAAFVLSTTACTNENSDTGKVVSITDGDTLVASVNGKNQTIRLLNIDTPETKDPTTPPECLGEEATEFLRGLLPVDSPIKLMYDVERTDQYDRTLAAVFTSDDELVSAEIARAGFGTAVVFGKNSKFLPPVQDAEKEAKATSRGIYDPDVQCTLPGQIAASTTALETAIATQPGSTAAATGSAITVAAAAIATAKSVKALLLAGKQGAKTVRWSAYTAMELETEIGLLTTKVEQAESNLKSLTSAEATLRKAETEAAAKKAAEAKAQKEETARVTKAAAAAKAQAEAAAAAETAAEAERIRNLPPVYVPPVYEPPAQDSGGGYPGYTGPRCYAPGGKTYRPC